MLPLTPNLNTVNSLAPSASPTVPVPVPRPASASSPLAPLAISDRALLTRYFSNDLDLFATAAQCPLELDELIAWTARPDIAAYIAHFRSLNHAQRFDRALTTLNALLDAIVNNDDHYFTKQDHHAAVEKRRSASTILRALSAAMNPAPKRRPRRDDDNNHTPPVTQTPRPRPPQAAATTPIVNEPRA